MSLHHSLPLQIGFHDLFSRCLWLQVSPLDYYCAVFSPVGPKANIDCPTRSAQLVLVIFAWLLDELSLINQDSIALTWIFSISSCWPLLKVNAYRCWFIFGNWLVHVEIHYPLEVKYWLEHHSLRFCSVLSATCTNEAETDHPEDGSRSTTTSAPPADGPRFTTDRVEILPLDRWLRYLDSHIFYRISKLRYALPPFNFCFLREGQIQSGNSGRIIRSYNSTD